MAPDKRFKKGLELFNRGEYFECHEVIEKLWLETPSEDPLRDFYKGIIQAAAAIYQRERGVAGGALSLYKTSLLYLQKYVPETLGLDVKQMIGGMERWFAEDVPPPRLKYRLDPEHSGE